MDISHFYVGSYTSAGGAGISGFSLDPRTGALAPLAVFGDVANPSFLLIDPRSGRLYAVNELEDYEGAPGGAVSAFSIHPDHTLAFLNRQASRGGAPCHLALDASGRHLMVANYIGGSFAILPILGNGSLGPASAFVQYRSEPPAPGSDPVRQASPHVHTMVLGPEGRHLLVVDLGRNVIDRYGLNPATGSLIDNGVPAHAAPLPPGSGPRFLVFHPNGRFAYLINELRPEITTFAWDPVAAKLSAIQSTPLLPPGFTGGNYGAHAQFSPAGKFLYASNRGHDSIAAFAVDAGSGGLILIDHYPTGEFPRHFALDPSGRFLIVANQRSNSLSVFAIGHDGSLAATPHSAAVTAPVCIAFDTTPPGSDS